MKRFYFLAASFVFLAVMAAHSFAQAPATKIGWIQTAAFADEKEGIAKYLTAAKAIDAEMKPKVLELTTLQAKLKTLSDDLNKMQSNPAVPVDAKAAAAK